MKTSFKKTAIDAAKSAGLLLKRNIGRGHTIEFKGVIDVVTEMDIKAEEMIMKTIRARFPEHGILTEESLEQKSGSGYRWILYPTNGPCLILIIMIIISVIVAVLLEGEIILG